MPPQVPTGTFDRRGNLTIAFPDEISASPFFPFCRLLLTNPIPFEGFTWDAAGDAVTIEWRSAHVVERTLLDMFPGAEITAEGNPHYVKGRQARKAAA